MSTPGQNSLNNFHRSVAFSNPRLADEMQEDIVIVALYALGADKSDGQAAADRLRRAAFDLPPLLSMVLANSLTDLGYS